MDDKNTQSTKKLRFLFVGTVRPWNPAKGHTAPEGKVCQLTCLPGDLYAWAPTFPEAVEKLHRGLLRVLKTDGPPSKWYATALQTMSNDHRKCLSDLWARVLLEQRPLQQAELDMHDVEVGVLHSNTLHVDEGKRHEPDMAELEDDAVDGYEYWVEKVDDSTVQHVCGTT